MKKLILISFLVALTVMSANCGYKLAGFSSQVPSGIKTIAIPDFDNKTSRYQIDQYITYSVREEFIKRSNLVLEENSSSADSLLEGTINRFDVKPISYSSDASANLYRVTVDVSVRFINIKTGQVIFEGDSITFSDDYEIDDDDFFTRETQTLLKIADECAASVVTTILENF